MDEVGRVVRRWAASCSDTDLRLLARLCDGGGLPRSSPGVDRFLSEVADAVRCHLALRQVDALGAAPDGDEALPPVA